MLNIINLILNIFNFYQKTLKIVDEFFLSIEKEIFLFIEKNFRVLILILVSILYLVCLGLMISYDYHHMLKIMELKQEIYVLKLKLKHLELNYIIFFSAIELGVDIIRILDLLPLYYSDIFYIYTAIFLYNAVNILFFRTFIPIKFEFNFPVRFEEFLERFTKPVEYNKISFRRFINDLITLDKSLQNYKIYFPTRDFIRLSTIIKFLKDNTTKLVHTVKEYDLATTTLSNYHSELTELIELVDKLSMVNCC